MDLGKIPAGWKVNQWMTFAVNHGIGFVDSTKEINKGVATGKLAGNLNTMDMKSVDVETGNYIQQHINLLGFIKAEMAEITGITPQRQGATSSSETLGGVERAVIQSSNSTEWWFYKHEMVKIRALTIFLETAKIALRGNKLKLQHILDDFSAEVFEIDGDEFAERDYDIFVTSEADAKDMKQVLNQMAHAFMQNGGSMGVVMDILFSKSMADKRRRIELVEFEKEQQAQAQQQQVQQMQQEQIAAQSEQADKQREFELYTVDSNNATKVLITQMQLNGQSLEIDAEENLSSKEMMMRIKELNSGMVQHKEKMEVEKSKNKLRKVS